MKISSIWHEYFDQKGRMNRMDFFEAFLSCVFGFTLSLLIAFFSVYDLHLKTFDLVQVDPPAALIALASIFFIISTLVSIAPIAKRCQDIGFSCLWPYALILVAATLWVWPDVKFVWFALYPGYFGLMLILLVIPGSKTKNKWGDPL